MEVTDQPPHYQAITKNPDPYKGREVELREMDFETLNEYVDNAKRSVTEKFPHLGLQIDRIYRLLYNVYLIKEGTEYTANDEDKRFAAATQHNLVHHFFYASTPWANNNYVRGMNRVGIMSELLSSRFTKTDYTRAAPLFWVAAKGELAVVKALSEADLRVIVPNYMQEWNAILPQNDEVLQMDVKSGVDLITIVPTDKGNKAVLIYVKTRAQPLMERPVVEEMPTRFSALNPLLRKKLDELDVVGVRRARVTLPTQALYRLTKPNLRHDDDVRVEMIKFCRLIPRQASYIIDDIQNMAS